MPNTTYGLLSLTRSHKIDSPKVETNKRSDRPNACNLCHVDRTLAWTSEWMSTWYGQSPATLNESERDIPAGARWLLAGDAVQRATAAWHLGWAPSFESADPTWRARLLIESLADPYAAVRYLAERSLRRLPQYSEFSYDFYESPTGKPPKFDSIGPQASRDTNLVPEWFDALRAQRIDRPITILE